MSTPRRLRADHLALAGALAIALVGAGVAPATSAVPSGGGSMAAADRGPLDPLTADEIDTTFAVIEANPKFPAGAYFPTVTLKEPPKSELLAWSPGAPFRREAFANVFDRPANRLFEVVVDLKAKKVRSWVEKTGVQPPVFGSEYTDADTVVRGDPRWVHAMQIRNVNPDDVYLDVWAAGDVLLPDVPPNTRLVRAVSFYSDGLANPYDRPIEGVIVTVDMNHLKVVDFVDSGIKPVQKAITGDATTTRTGLKPLIVKQPQGPSFKIKGNEVSWQGWHFRVGYEQRGGMVVHEIGYEHNGVVRPIIQRLAQTEVYVPYAIPDKNWVWRAALDYGEYNLGQWMEFQQVDVDVPENAVFFDEVAPSDLGSAGDPGAIELPHAIAMYERDAGVLWDRTDPTSLEKDARQGRELVLVGAYPNGNYTYITEYDFRLDGSIGVYASGIGTTLNRGISSNGADEQYGGTVANKIAAPNHQHFFNFRVDFDVDGTANRLVEENIQSVPSSFGNAFAQQGTVIGSEGFRDTNPSSERHWVIESTTNKNALGEPTAYALEPGRTAIPYSDPNWEPLRHAQFAQHQLWVTQYRDGELYPVGDYPNGGAAGEGLPKYVADHQSVNGKDLVVWYTGAFTHDTRVEDYPTMSRETIGFQIVPDGFFDEYPALDVP